VRLTLEGAVRDPVFVRYLERLGQETLHSFSTDDFLTLDYVHRELALPPHLQARVHGLVDLGALASVGRGSGMRYLLSQRLYAAMGAKGVRTRRKGLDHETKKALLQQHLSEQGDSGAGLAELRQVLPAESESAVQRLLGEMRAEGRVDVQGVKRWARWISVPKAHGA